MAEPHRPPRPGIGPDPSSDPYLPLRHAMVEIVAAHTEATREQTGIAHLNPRVVAAMLAVPRH